MRYRNLIVLGTSHIARESIEDVKRIILNKDPDIIALELDKKRFFALLHKRKRKLSLAGIRKIGVKGFLFNLIGSFVENRLGRYVGVKPGSEMLTAIRLAREKKKKIALVDQDIQITLMRFSKEFGFKEKWNLFKDIISAMFTRKKFAFDLTKVPSKKVITKMIKEVKEKYPNIYKVLIEERNLVMANNLYKVMKENPNKLIFAIIGAGHEEELIGMIKEKFLNA